MERFTAKNNDNFCTVKELTWSASKPNLLKVKSKYLAKIEGAKLTFHNVLLVILIRWSFTNRINTNLRYGVNDKNHSSENALKLISCQEKGIFLMDYRLIRVSE